MNVDVMRSTVLISPLKVLQAPVFTLHCSCLECCRKLFFFSHFLTSFVCVLEFQ